MIWQVKFLEEALHDLETLDNSSRIQILKAINKVAKNPVSQQEGGYGKPLGNKHGINLSGLYKIKLRTLGIRIVYKLEVVGGTMLIIVISARSDNKAYETAGKRTK